MNGPRQTLQTQLVLQALLQCPPEEAYGYAIATRVDLLPATTYRILARLDAAGWVETRREGPGVARSGGRRTCFYRLTPAGLGLARAIAPSMPAIPPASRRSV